MPEDDKRKISGRTMQTGPGFVRWLVYFALSMVEVIFIASKFDGKVPRPEQR